jgi:hypothetical protein
MTSNRFATAAVIALIATTATFAQYPIGASGLSVSTNLGQNAGNFCWGFSCTPAALTVAVGEVVTIRITGEWQVPYLLGVSSTATSCQPIGGVLNNLVLDLPIVILASGALSHASPILACPQGYTTLTAVVPAGIPTGTTFAIQALTYGAGNVLALTGAIVLTIA